MDSAPCNLTEPLKDTFKEISCNREFIKKRCMSSMSLPQLKIVNKQLGLLRTNPSNNASHFPLENVTNFINAVTNVMP